MASVSVQFSECQDRNLAPGQEVSYAGRVLTK